MRTCFLFASLALASASFAQTRSSFLEVDGFSDVFVADSNGGLTYTVSLGAAPKFFYNSQTYDITRLFGFWVLKDEDPDTLEPKNADIGVWRAVNNPAQGGEIAGWRTNPNTGLDPGESFTFTFIDLNAADVDNYGFHIMVDGFFPGTLGNTGYATLPEPASLSVLGLGLLALARKRRRKA